MLLISDKCRLDEGRVIIYDKLEPRLSENAWNSFSMHIYRNKERTCRRHKAADLGKAYEWTGLIEVFLQVSSCRCVTVSRSGLASAAECHMKLVTAGHHSLHIATNNAQ